MFKEMDLLQEIVMKISNDVMEVDVEVNESDIMCWHGQQS